MKALFGFFIVAFSVLAFQKMSNQEFVEAQSGANKDDAMEFCPWNGDNCIGLKTVIVRPKQ